MHDSRELFFGKIIFYCHDEDIGMAEPLDEVEIERVIAVAIYRHARGDVEAVARAVIADLREAGFETLNHPQKLGWVYRL